MKPSPSEPHAARPKDASTSASFEPFELRYLHALSDEGVDLHTFLGNWRQAMDEDIERLTAFHRQSDLDSLRAVLHRLSGAVGLVGAQSLMKDLSRASTSPLERDASSIDMLVERARALVMQLDIAVNAYRSTLR